MNSCAETFLKFCEKNNICDEMPTIDTTIRPNVHINSYKELESVLKEPPCDRVSILEINYLEPVNPLITQLTVLSDTTLIFNFAKPATLKNFWLSIKFPADLYMINQGAPIIIESSAELFTECDMYTRIVINGFKFNLVPDSTIIRLDDNCAIVMEKCEVLPAPTVHDPDLPGNPGILVECCCEDSAIYIKDSLSAGPPFADICDSDNGAYFAERVTLYLGKNGSNSVFKDCLSNYISTNHVYFEDPAYSNDPFS